MFRATKGRKAEINGSTGKSYRTSLRSTQPEATISPTNPPIPLAYFKSNKNITNKGELSAYTNGLAASKLAFNPLVATRTWRCSQAKPKGC